MCVCSCGCVRCVCCASCPTGFVRTAPFPADGCQPEVLHLFEVGYPPECAWRLRAPVFELAPVSNPGSCNLLRNHSPSHPSRDCSDLLGGAGHGFETGLTVSHPPSGNRKGRRSTATCLSGNRLDSRTGPVKTIGQEPKTKSQNPFRKIRCDPRPGSKRNFPGDSRSNPKRDKRPPLVPNSFCSTIGASIGAHSPK